MPFSFTGFADEAHNSLSGQIATLHEAGWSAIELRLLDHRNVCDLTDEEWKTAWETLQREEIEVVGFGGQIANWARPITGDFQRDIDELVRVAPRMRECGTHLLRIMSYPNDADTPLLREEWKAEVVRRIKELTKIADAEGIILGQENCCGYGETSEGFRELVAAVDHPSFQLIFDTGNTSLHENDVEATWKFYVECRDHIAHIHLKSAQPGPDGKFVTCHVDEDPVQRRIIEDLHDSGYDGWLSIEPHLKAAVHAGKTVDDEGDGKAVWLDYAQRVEKLVAEVTTPSSE